MNSSNLISGSLRARRGTRLIVGIFVVSALAGFASPGAAQGPATDPTAPPAADPTVVEVRMVDRSPTEFVFEPAEFEVSRGTIVRFIQTAQVPHNVEFKDSPDGTDLGAARMGPFLLTPGAVYEVVIDDRFGSGTHRFVCTPHELMGMVGTMTISDDQ